MTWEIPEVDRPYVTDWWADTYTRLASGLGPQMPDDFLVRLWPHGLFMDDNDLADQEWQVCLDHFGDDEATRLVAEPDLPRVSRKAWQVYPNSAHHLYHLAVWEQTTGCDLADVRSVVEWGGGYGSLARIIGRHNPDLTVADIDLPFLRLAASRYMDLCDLRVFPDSDDLRFLPTAPSASLDLRCDLFISTWALDESSRHAQQAVADTRFYGADHLLIAFHPGKDIFPDSGALADLLPPDCRMVSAGPSGSFYALR